MTTVGKSFVWDSSVWMISLLLSCTSPFLLIPCSRDGEDKDEEEEDAKSSLPMLS